MSNEQVAKEIIANEFKQKAELVWSLTNYLISITPSNEMRYFDDIKEDVDKLRVIFGEFIAMHGVRIVKNG